MVSPSITSIAPARNETRANEEMGVMVKESIKTNTIIGKTEKITSLNFDSTVFKLVLSFRGWFYTLKIGYVNPL